MIILGTETIIGFLFEQAELLTRGRLGALLVRNALHGIAEGGHDYYYCVWFRIVACDTIRRFGIECGLGGEEEPELPSDGPGAEGSWILIIISCTMQICRGRGCRL